MFQKPVQLKSEPTLVDAAPTPLGGIICFGRYCVHACVGFVLVVGSGATMTSVLAPLLPSGATILRR